MYENLIKRNEMIVDAIVKKSKKVCPDSLALIAIGGSFSSGDMYEKSDLDLLILINDDNGWQLGYGFIQKDLMVGHDLYCTKWNSLEANACYTNPNIAKLMDSKIVYCADEKYVQRLEELRKKVRGKLEAPFSKEDYDSAYKQFTDAKQAYCDMSLSDEYNQIHVQAGEMLYSLENAVAMINKKYFRRGVKRCMEEIRAMEIVPDNFCENVEKLVRTKDVHKTKEIALQLMKSVKNTFEHMSQMITEPKHLPEKERLWGTYEEMYSNWRNKMYHAVDLQNPHLSYMSLLSLSSMFDEMKEYDIGEYKVYDGYEPDDLKKTAQYFDQMIDTYLENYKKIGLPLQEFDNVEEFTKKYLS